MRKLYTILSLCLILCNYLSAQNTDFEASSPGTYTTPNALTNWTISSQTATSCIPTTTWTAGSPEFSLITTPILSLPNIGNLPNSPLGGTNIARLGNTTANGSVTRMTHTLAVTSTNMLLCYAFAGLWESGSHNCCEQSSFNIKIRDASGNLLSCQVHTLVTPACSASSSFSTFSTFSVTSGTYWSNWQARYTDLFSYIGSTVSIEVTASDCTSGDHYGSLFLDISNPPTLPPGCLPITTVMSPFQNNFCGVL